MEDTTSVEPLAQYVAAAAIVSECLSAPDPAHVAQLVWAAWSDGRADALIPLTDLATVRELVETLATEATSPRQVRSLAEYLHELACATCSRWDAAYEAGVFTIARDDLGDLVVITTEGVGR